MHSPSIKGMLFMSTVLLTPTHIACDHTVVFQTHPTVAKIIPKPTKMFIPKHRRFAVLTVGNYDPKQINTPVVFSALEDILTRLIKAFELTGDTSFPLKPSDTVNTFLKTFDPTAKTFLVTKEYRFVLHTNKQKDFVDATVCDDFVGSGSGGMFGVGLLVGGMAITDIWETLHGIDPLTSVKHTIVEIASLNDWI